MFSFEMQVNVLARVICTGNDEIITESINAFKQLLVPDNYTSLLDNANLPFLVEAYGNNNETAKNFIKDHRALKAVQMASEAPFIAKEFYDGTMRASAEGSLPDHIVQLLTIMIHMTDSNYIRTGLQLLRDLRFKLKDLEVLMARLQKLRQVYPEAHSLIQKIEAMQLEMDEQMESDEDEEEEQHLSNPNATFQSNQPTIVFEEEKADLDEQQLKYKYAKCEVYLNVLSNLIKTGDSFKIALGVKMALTVLIPIAAYRKYEITSLIMNHASECKEADELWEQIDQYDKVLSATEDMNTFNFLMEDIENHSTITEPIMDILVGYLSSKNQYQLERVFQLLTDKAVPLELFQQHRIKQFLLEYLNKPAEVWILLFKIYKMEEAEEV
uniref:Rod_C domain-containing protein n=1 Tax=Caenorhabditis tropicalis TaxID=1561998 RepID=A0A1I7TY30_9PELO